MPLDLSPLNTPQRDAVLHGDAPLLVLAGAGTGKTTVVAHRIAHLMEERGVRPDRILAVTFTNKAAREMRERVGRTSGRDPRLLDIGTFHAICGRLLRRYGQPLGLDPGFVIYDEADQLQLIRRLMAELAIDSQVFAPATIRQRLERWKNQGRTPKEIEPSEVDPIEKRAAQVYASYEAACLKENAVDFGDLLLHAVSLLKEVPDVKALLRARWSHLLVDEYQDTNPVQYQLLRQLVTDAHSLTVVGDDDQSIYRWRGADIGNILRFERDFAGARVVRLEQNYRSTQTILDAANGVIAHNVSRKGKTLYTRRPGGERLRLRLFVSERDEGDAIAADVKAFLAQGQGPQDIAILYRTNAQSRPIEDALRREKIPYAVYGGIRFYDRKEIKDALAYLRLLVNPRSSVDFLRVVNEPARGIGKTSLERLQALALARGMVLIDAAALAAAGDGDLPNKARAALGGLVELQAGLRGKLATSHPARLVEEVLERSGYLPALRKMASDEADERIANLAELAAAVDEYAELNDNPTLAGFLEEVTLATDVDDLDPEVGLVTMMTLHSAKGLEFRVVFMPGMEEGLFPHSRSFEERAGMEEERRLCYVGITRAREHLLLSAVRMRTIFGRTTPSDVSRFITEIPDKLLDYGREEVGDAAPTDDPGVEPVDLAEPDDVDESEPLFAPTPGRAARLEPLELGVPYPRGTRVIHATFGEGRVLESEGRGERAKLTIDFPSVGRKVIVARFVDRA